MFRHYRYGPFRAQRFEAPWRSSWQGRRGGWDWERNRSSRPPLIPLLLAGLLVRAALRRGAHGTRFGHGAPWTWGQPPDTYGWHRHEHGHGRGHGRGFGGSWGRGRRGRPNHEHGESLRSEIGPLIAIVRDTMRRGGPTPRQLGQIREVLVDARTRVAAILAEGQQPPTMV